MVVMRGLIVSRIEDPKRTLDLLLMREVLKSARLFGSAEGHAGLAQDNFVDVIAEAVVNATSHHGAGTNTHGAHKMAPPPHRSGHSHGSAGTGVLSSVVDGPARVSSGFGERTDPFTGKHTHHHGLDIAAAEGTAITSVSAGTVVHAGPAGGYGLVVDVKGDDGELVRYAHASAINVKVGERVNVGDEIAAVGSTGRSTGPHLHLEVRKNGEAVDPTTALLAAGIARKR